ncbi:MAG: DUF3836 domain-containing protein [Chitinophagaceae bacterium]|jgi:hypothetical protein|nr:DUF3836 domain-containing protein [Chitinophagaceae bacterium]
MKQLLIAFFAVITFMSCNKDNDDQPSTGTRLIEQKTGEDEYVKLQYGTNGKVVKAIVVDENITEGEEVTYNITYNAAGRISQVTNSNGETIIAEYQNDRLIKAVIKAGPQEIGHTDYQYENGRLKGAEIFFNLVSEEVPSMKYAFTYDAQQRVSKSELWMINIFSEELEPAGRTEIQYDNKKNPLYELADFLLLVWEVPAENNIVKETQYASDNTVDEVRDYIFTYNAKDYPVTAIMRTTMNGQQQESNLRFSYN